MPFTDHEYGRVTSCQRLVPVPVDGQAGARQHRRLAHPVLRARPRQPADLGRVAGDRVGVGDRGGLPAAMQRQLGEPAGVKRPPVPGARQPSPAGQGPVADHQRHLHPCQPSGLVGAEEQPAAVHATALWAGSTSVAAWCRSRRRVGTPRTRGWVGAGRLARSSNSRSPRQSPQRQPASRG
jgi:hypothetical protein